MKDWQERAIKTFIQAFGGVLIPELVMILNGEIPKEWNGLTCVIITVLCPALAAGISAAWNIILEHLKEDSEE
jgi:hypothetical protein